MNIRSQTPRLLVLSLCIAMSLGLAACGENNSPCMQALKQRDARIKELQLAVLDLNQKLKNLRSVLQMKHEEVGVFRDTPVMSSSVYKECRRKADRLQAQLEAVERERDEYKLRYQALKKHTGQ